MVEVCCNLCGSKEWRLRFPATMQAEPQVEAFRCTSPTYGHHAQIVECVQCGYVYANPRLGEEELLAAYAAVEDSTYVQEREGRELTFRRHLQHLEKVVGGANGRSLLDVGAYIGVFVEVAAEAGWQVWGVEPSSWAVGEAQKRGLRVLEGTQDAPELVGRQFDVVTMWDVIEHVDDPTAEMHKAYDLLKPGGWLVVHTMDVDSLTAKLMGPRWPWLMDMHLHYFSQATLAKMMGKVGLEVVWSGTRGRYLRMGYLVTRLGGLHPLLGRLAGAVVNGLGLRETAVPVNFGDLFTVYGRKR
ncbi:MAG: class I SAM-dependent methyltransferase [Ardenticatenaceae bacterium]|nr:class I SAM-dependent methyltransferase [Ardenticatenaceae bacterium]